MEVGLWIIDGPRWQKVLPDNKPSHGVGAKGIVAELNIDSVVACAEPSWKSRLDGVRLQVIDVDIAIF